MAQQQKAQREDRGQCEFLIETCENLCREFDGTFLRIDKQNVPQAIAQIAAEYHITQIVIGESQQPTWKRLLKGSFTQKLMKHIHHQHIDLHIIATEK
ncbi:universal stress protein [Thermoleptolyngbya sichuanensis A183]|uniref:Universal stress protein n=1 Tax=Thermoleptolyngbya sichuanensis A183 TaxID=2737172 RepID=A0A6M8BDC4_9CYAN|nr:universal stress protein [Thermoleptolyngbya sichuanensis]QKD84814.1 universal stress protein [Thermoleptolyngbya sichuanensis A183]